MKLLPHQNYSVVLYILVRIAHNLYLYITKSMYPGQRYKMMFLLYVAQNWLICDCDYWKILPTKCPHNFWTLKIHTCQEKNEKFIYCPKENLKDEIYEICKISQFDPKWENIPMSSIETWIYIYTFSDIMNDLNHLYCKPSMQFAQNKIKNIQPKKKLRSHVKQGRI